MMNKVVYIATIVALALPYNLWW